MNFLSTYGDDDSSSESDGENNAQTTTIPLNTNTNVNPVSNTNISSSSNLISNSNLNPLPATAANISTDSLVKPEKKKKLDVSILPKHIQDALQRGVTNDSDSDDDIDSKPLIKSVSMIKGKSLISQLPKPKEDVDSVLNVNQSMKEHAGGIHATKSIAERKSQFVPPISGNFNNNKLPSKIGYNPTGDSGGGFGVAAGVSTAPAIQMQHSNNSNPCMDMSSDRHEVGETATMPSNMTNYDPNPYSSTDMSLDMTEHAHAKRRRLEAQLLSGNIDVLNSNMQVANDIPVVKGSDWNANSYLMQQEKEMELKKSFGLGTKVNSHMAMAPTKQQNRKHQINSLAVAAVNMEIAMLEARGKRNVSKAQTQGKYGW